MNRPAAKEKGQGMVEYALVLALISVLLTAAILAYKDALLGSFSNIVNSLPPL